MNINWKVRLKNKTFYLSLIPALLLVAQSLADVFGYSVPVELISEKAITIVNALFVLLTILGVVNDPTTKGVSDSEQAQTYTEPN